MKLGEADPENFKFFVVDGLIGSDWRKTIVEYLENLEGTTKRKENYRSLSSALLSNELFKKTAEGILLKCLGDSEAYLEISNVHSGVCGAHQEGHKMKWLLY